MEIAKALVLTGCHGGRRPWPSAPAGSGYLFPIANQPILFHSLEELRAAGLLEATIALGPVEGDTIARAVGDGSAWALSVRYAACSASDGLVETLAASRDFIGDEPLIVQHGDALLRNSTHDHIKDFARGRLDALALRLDRRDHHVTAAYLLSPRAISTLLDRPRTERDLLTAVRAQGGRVRVEVVDGSLPCHGDQESLLESNRRMLEMLTTDVPDSAVRDCEIQGDVVIHPAARLQRCTVRGPAIIGAGCRMTDTYIGPFSSIGADVVIEATEIEHSIVLSNAELRFVGTRLESSVIGRGARIVREFRIPSAMRMSLGDGVQITLP